MRVNDQQLTSSAPRVPGFVVVFSVLAFVVALVVLVAGAMTVGSTWDEFGLARFFQSYLDNGWFTEPTAVINGIPDLGQIWYLYSYGPVAFLLGYLIAILSGVDTTSSVSLSANAFAIRHVGTALWGLLGIGATGATAWVILRSWRWALVAVALLASIPLWIGHGMFNVKDIPVATAYSLATFAAAAMCLGSVWQTPRRRVVVIGVLVSALVLGAGTRPFIGIMIVASIAIALIFRAVWGWWSGIGTLRPWIAALDTILAGVLAYAILLAVYPKLFSDPIALGVGSYLEARQFAFNEQLMVAGQWLTQPVPRWYLPVWFAAQLPVVVLGGAIFGVASWAYLVARGRGVRTWEPAALFPVVVQAFAAAGAAILTGAVIYNGSRQYLFVVPAIAMLATYGIRGVISYVSKWRQPVVAVGTTWLLVLLGIAAPIYAQIQLFPYSYVYFNAAAVATGGVDGAWPTDYWRASSRELMNRIPPTGTEGCAYEQGLWNRFAPCSREQMFQPYLDERGFQATAQTQIPDSYWVVRENQGVVTIPAGCRVADEITRRNLWVSVTIAQILECPVTTPWRTFGYPPPTLSD